MEKLLQWSTAQQSSDPAVRASVPAPDPKLLAQVLGADTGKDDATLMKEDILVLVTNDERISVDDKLTALEDFEILIQNLDNAINMLNMGIWPEIIKLYKYQGEEEDEFKGMAALITGSATQNHLKCQNDFLKVAGNEGLSDLLKLTSNGENFNVRSRALYALSGLITHNSNLYKAFTECAGWETLHGLLLEEYKNDRKDNKVLLRALNLFKNLLFDEIVEEGELEVFTKLERFDTIRKNNLLSAVINKLSKEAHVDVNDRVLSIIVYVSSNGYSFSSDELKLIKEKIEEINSIKDLLNAEDLETVEKLL